MELSIEPAWTVHGLSMDHHGRFMDCWCSVHEPTVDHDGLPIEPQWTFHGTTVSVPRTRQGPSMDPALIHRGPTMDYHGLSIEHHGLL